jgi:hypothetical protein
MDTSLVKIAALQTLAGTISFPEVVDALLGTGLDVYQVDYVGLRKTFYGADGELRVRAAISINSCRANAVW